MKYAVKTAAASEPLDLTTVKSHLVIDTTDHDTMVTRLIKVARQFVEKHSGYIPIETVFYGYIDQWPSSGLIYIGRMPVTEFSKVEYKASDDNDNYTELEASGYVTSINGLASVYIKETPNLGDRLDNIRITFTAGNETANAVPENIKQAMLILIGHLWENRQEEITGTMISKLGKGFEYLLQYDEVRMA